MTPRIFFAQLAALSLVTSGALLLSGCGGGASAAPSLPPTNGNLNRIAFSSNRDGNFEIYTMNPDGNDVQRVTTATGDDTKPAWSRDKTKIAFVSERDGNSEIYVQNVASGKPVGAAQRLTNDSAFDGAPSWNPQGTQLVFESDRATRSGTDRNTVFERALYVVNTNTRDVRRLTQRPGFVDQNPAWSPRGDLIAFQSKEALIKGQNYPEGVPSYIYTLKENSEDIRQITNNFLSFEPSWHPDGNKIAFSQSNSRLNIVEFDLTSKKLNNLTPVDQDSCTPTDYSPNGQQMVCSLSTSENENGRDNSAIGVFDVKSPTFSPTRLTNGLSSDIQPNW